MHQKYADDDDDDDDDDGDDVGGKLRPRELCVL